MDESALKTLLSTLDASRASLHASFRFWEWVVVIGVAVELVVIIFEFCHEWRDWRRAEMHPPEKPSVSLMLLALLGVALVAGGISEELAVDSKIEGVETEIRKVNGQLFGMVSEEATKAHAEADAAKGVADTAKHASDKASLAADKAQYNAGKAEESLGKAESESKGAQTAASKALALATRASTEADSFEQDIKTAKEQAAEAESHLADAKNSADVLTAELERLETPRSLSNSAQIVSSLKTFDKTEYMFVDVCADTECIDLLKAIDGALNLAGWNRDKSHHAFPGLAPWGQGEGEVGIDLVPGIRIVVDDPQWPLDEKLPLGMRPQWVQAAVTLNLLLKANISPPDKKDHLVEAATGTSAVVRISVGRKPIP